MTRNGPSTFGRSVLVIRNPAALQRVLKLLVLCLFGAVASANISLANTGSQHQCIDYPPVGDGWGWDGFNSCELEKSPDLMPGPCVDTDGDGWGWNGIESCLLPMPAVGACIDTDGDGWGWDGMASCRIFKPVDGAYYVLQNELSRPAGRCLEGNRLLMPFALDGGAFMDACQNVSGQRWRFVDMNNGYYKLQNRFLEAENKCLEGNKPDALSTIEGASFMDDCQDVSGQLWSITPVGDNTFQLQTQFLQPENKCLEGNRFMHGATLNGASFMDDCGNFTGQIWTATLESNFHFGEPGGFVPKQDVYYTLQTLLSQPRLECFESNFVDPASTLFGAAFMDGCGNFSGQQWKFVAENNGYYRLQSLFREPFNECLESSRLDPGLSLGGAARMDPCGNFSGQLWEIIDLGGNAFKLQSMFRKPEGECLSGNALNPGSPANGAAFMASCASLRDQIWYANEI